MELIKEQETKELTILHLETSELKLMLDMGNFLGYATPNYTLDWMQLASTRRTENQTRLP